MTNQTPYSVRRAEWAELGVSARDRLSGPERERLDELAGGSQADPFDALIRRRRSEGLPLTDAARQANARVRQKLVEGLAQSAGYPEPAIFAFELIAINPQHGARFESMLRSSSTFKSSVWRKIITDAALQKWELPERNDPSEDRGGTDQTGRRDTGDVFAATPLRVRAHKSIVSGHSALWPPPESNEVSDPWLDTFLGNKPYRREA